MKLLIVADGPRDEASLPPLLEVILSRTIESQFAPWRSIRIHQKGTGGGYHKKLRFSVGQARSRGLDGLVAVVDRDKDHEKFRDSDLHAAREADRQQGTFFPTALGVADPYVDVWLLDDPVAVRSALSLPPNTDVINVRKTKDPKAELDRLTHLVPDHHLIESLQAIAAQVDPKHCAHAKETGFADFMEDCRRELSQISP